MHKGTIGNAQNHSQGHWEALSLRDANHQGTEREPGAVSRKSGRSLAQEVEFRLEQSIERDQRNTLTFGYANQSRPLIVHKGSLILVLDPNTAIDLEIKPAELQTLMRYIKHWQDELK